ncbi:MBL fold metallo-hydrolase [Flexithrix dorotheae]|uniref:MBL fold metallo-hydrolase n=1 Tax=Flexithrix dorotheae TaxID=70993 RepID=UPI00036D8DE9|nr:MBL fold metallo-hydrolase [Flexithrix dorotheae]
MRANFKNLHFKWIGGATWVMYYQGLRIACDPVLCQKGTLQDYGFFKSKRITAPEFAEYDFKDIDLWLITHAHEDHLDAEGLKKIESDAKIITHKNALKKLSTISPLDIKKLKNGEKMIFQKGEMEVEVEAMPAVHGANLFSSVLAGGVNGYWINIQYQFENTSIYITGDTILNEKVRNKLKNRKADILIPNMGGVLGNRFGGPLTLNAEMLDELTKLLNPALVFPVHINSFKHYSEPVDKLKSLKFNGLKFLKEGDSYAFSA